MAANGPASPARAASTGTLLNHNQACEANPASTKSAQRESGACGCWADLEMTYALLSSNTVTSGRTLNRTGSK